MKVYFDLMFVYYIMTSICSLVFVKNILVCSMERRKIIGISFINSFSIIIVYITNQIFGYFLTLTYFFVTLIIFFRKKALHYYLLFILFYAFLNVLNLLCYQEFLTIRNGIVVIKDPIGAFSYLTFPIMFISIILVSKAVDSLYRLRNYKTIILLGSSTNKKVITAYFDSGNTLRYRNCPVIFLRDGIYNFSAEEKVEGEIITILKKQYGVKSLYKTLVKTKVSADSYFVYVAVKDDYRKYNGCDALLNLYLGG